MNFRSINNQEKVILFINYNAYPCVVGGLEIFNLYLINELSKTYNIDVLTFCQNTKYTENISVYSIKQSKFSKISTPIKTFLFIFKNRKKIRLVHISYTYSFWSYYLVHVFMKKFFDIKYMITIHDGNFVKWRPKWPYTLFFRQANKVTAVSDRIIRNYEKRTGRRDLIFTPPLIPFNIISHKNKFRQKWKIKQDEVVLLYVGSLKPLKSVNTLIDALSIISHEKMTQNKLKVLIAGDGVSKKELEDKVIHLGLKKDIIFLGNVDTGEISELYNLADVFTLCSEYEGLPIVLLEAFANSLPCITSDAPGLISISQNNRNTILFKMKDSTDYANKLNMVFSNIELQRKLKNNGNNYYQSLYSYDVFIDNYKSIIDSI